METYRFKTKISKSGIIRIPGKFPLHDKEVEVTLVPKETKSRRKDKAKNFVDEWAGFLQSTNTDNSRYDYLMDKYK
jgi:hypothetical protein